MKISTTALLLILSIIVLSGCSSSTENAEVIDYATLEELPVEMVMEIGESESYLPGEFAELEIMGDGTILVEDEASVTIEQFNSDGEYVGTVAQAGRGPGELDDNFSLYTLGDDTLVYRDFSTKKNYYIRTGSGLFEHVKTTVRNESLNRRFYIQGAVTGNKFYVISDKIIPPQEAVKNQRSYVEEAFVVVDAKENILQDSVHVLKQSAQFIIQQNGGFIYSIVPYRSIDHVVPLQEGKYLIARPDSSAFFMYNENHDLERRIPFRVKERLVTDEDLEYVFEGRPTELRREVENVTPEVKPPYQDISASENYLWVITGESDAGKEVVVADFEGEAVGKFMLSENERIEHAEDERIYTIYSDPDQGTVIRIYEVDI